jgi:hypothetical protein
LSHEADIVGILDENTLSQYRRQFGGNHAAAEYLVSALKSRGFDTRLLSAGPGADRQAMSALTDLVDELIRDWRKHALVGGNAVPKILNELNSLVDGKPSQLSFHNSPPKTLNSKQHTAVFALTPIDDSAVFNQFRARAQPADNPISIQCHGLTVPNQPLSAIRERQQVTEPLAPTGIACGSPLLAQPRYLPNSSTEIRCRR